MLKKSKNLCVVTWFGSPNFGTNLQAFSLCNILERNGHSVKILATLPTSQGILPFLYHCISNSTLYRIWLWLKTKLKKSPKEYYTSLYGYPRIKQWAKTALHPIAPFSARQVQSLVSDTDCFIVGSDQVWNTYVQYNPTMFLSFADNKKRISYASSLGTTGINPNYRDQVKTHLSKFSHIGVREISSIPVINELLGKTIATGVLDPTLLLTADDWNLFCDKPEHKCDFKTDNYIVCYLIGENLSYKENVLNIWRLSNIKNLVIIPACENMNFSISGAVSAPQLTPPEFVWLLKNAALICTDSFHATALSINLGVPFVELLRFDDNDADSQNSRIFNILNRYNLESRLYSQDSREWLKPIDYSKTHKLLTEDRKRSLAWLLNAIEN